MVTLIQGAPKLYVRKFQPLLEFIYTVTEPMNRVHILVLKVGAYELCEGG